MKKQQATCLINDIANLYRKDIGDVSKALDSQLMLERQIKVGEFANISRKDQVTDLGTDLLLSLHLSLMTDWMHYHTRCIIPLYRNVKVTSRADSNKKYTSVVRSIANSLEIGESLKGRVSRTILKNFKRKQLREDPLLWHWGVHHFHLGDFDSNLGYNTGSDDLLFAYIDQSRAIIIGIGNHNDFESDWILNTLLNDAPDLVESYSMKEILGIAGRQNHIRKNFWDKNNPMFEFRGKTLIPIGKGVTTSGHSTRITLNQNDVYHSIDSFDRKNLFTSAHYRNARLSFSSVCLEVRHNNNIIFQSKPLI